MNFTDEELRAMYHLIQDCYEEDRLQWYSESDRNALLSAMDKIHDNTTLWNDFVKYR